MSDIIQEFDYFKANEHEQYLFLQLPLMLIKDERFKDLSDGSKILYSLLLNRTSLSIKNGWTDTNGNVYIIYTIEEIMEDLNCWEKKATKTMKELKEIGLIKTVRQGLGKPNLIYVMNFATALKYKPKDKKEPANPSKYTDLSKEQFSNCQKHNSAIVEMTNLNLSKAQSINNDFKKNDFKKNDFKKMSSQSATPTDNPENNPVDKSEDKNGQDKTDRTDNRHTENYEELIKDNIEYSRFTNPRDIAFIDELVAIMVDVITSKGGYVRLDNEDKNRDIVTSRLLKLNSDHITHVIENFRRLGTSVTKRKQYLLTMLYNASMEFESYYEQY